MGNALKGSQDVKFQLRTSLELVSDDQFDQLMAEDAVDQFFNAKGKSKPEDKCDAELLLEKLSPDEAAELKAIFE